MAGTSVFVDLPESRDRYGHLEATGGYSFTHVGQLTRIDGSAFAVHQAEKILESLRVFLSFARGVLPPLSVGEITLRLYAALNYSQNSAHDLRRTIIGA